MRVEAYINLFLVCILSYIYIYSFPVAGFDWSLHFKWESLPNSGVAKQDATDAFL